MTHYCSDLIFDDVVCGVDVFLVFVNCFMFSSALMSSRIIRFYMHILYRDRVNIFSNKAIDRYSIIGLITSFFIFVLKSQSLIVICNCIYNFDLILPRAVA